MSWIELINVEKHLESEVHPHCPQEKAELFCSFDNGSTEIEVLAFLRAIVQLIKPQFVLETGTFLGIGAIAIGHALRENGFGKLITLETKQELCEKAKEKIYNCGLSGYVEIVNMDSLQFIAQLSPRGFLKFDFAFFDSATPVRIKEFWSLWHKGLLANIVAFHDTSIYREKTLTIPGEPQSEYLAELDKIEKKCCRGRLEFNLSRGLRIMQLGQP